MDSDEIKSDKGQISCKITNNYNKGVEKAQSFTNVVSFEKHKAQSISDSKAKIFDKYLKHSNRLGW